jgi:hypothetical protein
MEPPDIEAAFEENYKKRLMLLDKYKKTEALYNNFTQNMKTNLELSHPSKSLSKLKLNHKDLYHT